MWLVQITLDSANDDLRLRRLLCGKALPFRRTCVLKNLFRAGWQAQPSSLRGTARGARHWPESRRLSAQQGGRAAVSTRLSC
jgi:hypothetical protein